MSREIEFRAWDDKYCQFDYDFFISSAGEVFNYARFKYDTPNTEIEKEEDFIIEQYIGFKDCNLEKIFEGDMVKAPCGHVGSVIFSGASFSVEDYDSGDYYQGQNPDSWDWSKFEVIGNIHQNSELLK